MNTFFKTTFLLLLISSTTSAGTIRDSWQQVTEHAAFAPRDTACGASFLGKLWISGGYPDGMRDLWSSPDGVTWTKVLDETPYDVYSQLVVFKDKLWAIGGSVWSSSDGVRWERVSGNTPFCCRGSIVVLNGKMWQLGAGPFVWWSQDGINWNAATRAAPFGNRNSAAVAVHDGKLWLMGGSLRARGKGYANVDKSGYPDLDMMNDVWCSRDGAHWQRVVDHAPWKGRMWSAAQSYAGRLWLMAGYDNDSHSNFGDTWYSMDGSNWTAVNSDKHWSARHEPTSFVFQDSLWIAAGNSWPFTNDVWRLNSKPMATSFWSRMLRRLDFSRAPSTAARADCSGALRSDCFAFFDTTKVAPESKGFYGGIFDGRYVYLVPTYDGSGFSGQVTRYDTTKSFTDTKSWQSYDTTQIDPKSKGFVGAAFDGRYIYFAPFFNREPSGQVTRYDTSGPFDARTSWSVYDTTQVDPHSKGFRGAVFDGRYVYLVPFQNGIFDRGVMHGQVTRYDTREPFTSPSSWSVFDTTAVSPESKGFIGGIFDGRYVYFVPNSDGSRTHGQVTRFDTTQPFTSRTSWSVFDTAVMNPGSKGFNGAAFDGRYIYLVPFYGNDGAHGHVTRFDTLGRFTSPSSWRVYDVTAVDSDSRGFGGAVFDGRYVYFVPNSNGAPDGELTRYDSRRAFTSADAWSVYDLTMLSPGAAGFRGGVFDGRYIYLVPDNNGAADGLVARISGYSGGSDLERRLWTGVVAAEGSSTSDVDSTPGRAVANAVNVENQRGAGMITSMPFEKADTALADVPHLAVKVEAAKTYTFEFSGFVTASPVGGYQFAIGCSCTASDVVYEIVAVDNGSNAIRVSSRHTIIDGNDGNAGGTDIFVRITGTIHVQSAGVLYPEFAQEVAHGKSLLAIGSQFEVHEAE